jgi:hypothetical protein
MSQSKNHRTKAKSNVESLTCAPNALKGRRFRSLAEQRDVSDIALVLGSNPLNLTKTDLFLSRTVVPELRVHGR